MLKRERKGVSMKQTKIVSILTSAALCTSLMPAVAFATPEDQTLKPDVVKEEVVAKAEVDKAEVPVAESPIVEEAQLRSVATTDATGITKNVSITLSNGVATVATSDTSTQDLKQAIKTLGESSDADSVEQIVFGQKIVAPADCSDLLGSNEYYSDYVYFRNLSSIEGLKNLDTSNVTDTSYMFSACRKLPSLDVSGFDTSKVTDISGMFYDCGKLSSLDVSGFDTSKVTDMRSMFSGCIGLTSLDVTGFNTSEVTDMYAMFSDCAKLTSLNVSKFNTDKVTSMSYMFSGCSELTSLDLSNFKTSNVEFMYRMFGNCTNLINLNISSFNFSKVSGDLELFSGMNGVSKTYKLPACLTTSIIKQLNNNNTLDIPWVFTDTQGNRTVIDKISEGNKAGTYSLSFEDSSDPKAWFFDPINQAVRHEFMTGYTGTRNFGPYDTTTREAMIVTLYRLAGYPAIGPALSSKIFPDVASVSPWAINAVTWAANSGVATGIDQKDGTFLLAPQVEITREQLSKLMYELVQVKNEGMTIKEGSVDPRKPNPEGPKMSSFPDAKNVSSWATEGVEWVISWEIVTGLDGKIQPQDNATRAELATMIMRDYDYIESESWDWDWGA